MVVVVGGSSENGDPCSTSFALAQRHDTSLPFLLFHPQSRDFVFFLCVCVWFLFSARKTVFGLVYRLNRYRQGYQMPASVRKSCRVLSHECHKLAGHRQHPE